jgi:Tfp pilus assembly protein FimT
MVNKKTLSMIVLVLVVAIIAVLAYWTMPVPVQQNAANSTASLLNSSSLGSFNGTTSSPAIQNQTLNSSVSQDQNYSVLSNGQLIASP